MLLLPTSDEQPTSGFPGHDEESISKKMTVNNGPIRLLASMIKDMKVEIRRNNSQRRQPRDADHSIELDIDCGDLLKTESHHSMIDRDHAEVHVDDPLQALFHSAILYPSRFGVSDDEFEDDDDDFSVDDLFDGFEEASLDGDSPELEFDDRHENLTPLIAHVSSGSLRLRLLSATSSIEDESEGEEEEDFPSSEKESTNQMQESTADTCYLYDSDTEGEQYIAVA
jgi:hypothetical protein